MKYLKFPKKMKIILEDFEETILKLNSSHQFQNKVFYVFMRKYYNFIMKNIKLKCNVTHETFPKLGEK